MILSEKFDKAYLFAAKLHRKQKRKNIPSPYMVHLMAVASMVAENCNDEDTAIAAMLHDAVEDQGGYPIFVQIREQFGDKVADLVYQVIDSVDNPRPPKEERRRVYLEKIQNAPLEAVIISCCDKIHNLRTMYADFLVMGDALWQAFSAPPAQTMSSYRQLHAVYKEKLADSRLLTLFEEILTQVENIAPKSN